jgi:hypothetical protein
LELHQEILKLALHLEEFPKQIDLNKSPEHMIQLHISGGTLKISPSTTSPKVSLVVPVSSSTKLSTVTATAKTSPYVRSYASKKVSSSRAKRTDIVA